MRQLLPRATSGQDGPRKFPEGQTRFFGAASCTGKNRGRIGRALMRGDRCLRRVAPWLSFSQEPAEFETSANTDYTNLDGSIDNPIVEAEHPIVGTCFGAEIWVGMRGRKRLDFTVHYERLPLLMKPSRFRFVALIIIILLSFGVEWGLKGFPDFRQTFNDWLPLVFVLAGASGLTAFLVWLPKRIALKKASKLRRVDRRRPILYLRTFKDDGHFQLSRPRGWFPFRLLHHLEFEDVVATAAGAFGPVVALGRPGEKLPPLGCTREYVEHRDWRGRVETLMEDCAAVILVLGKADGFNWEVRSLIERGYIHKAVVLIPPLTFSQLQARWRGFAEVAESAGVSTLPTQIPAATVAFAFNATEFPRFVSSELRHAQKIKTEPEDASQYSIAVQHLVEKVSRSAFDELNDEFRVIVRAKERRVSKSGHRRGQSSHIPTGFLPPSGSFEPPREWRGD